MSAWIDLLFVAVVLLDLVILASSRLRGAIRSVALQGALLSLLPVVLAGADHQAVHVVVLALGALLLKGLAIPGLLLWSLREATSRRELRPTIGFAPSMLLGAAGVVLAFAFAGGLPLPVPERHPFLVPTALATAWTGLVMVMARREAAAQVLGFLVLENGVFVFGVLLTDFMPVMVEAGVLLDLFAAVFVMGLVMFHINRELDSLDTGRLSNLRD
jgi:hydrogenase-4 component E